MSDLISRNALLDAIPKNDELLSVDVRRIICEAPIIDAEPVRHGRWVYDPNGMDFNLGAWVCSECRERNNNLGGMRRINPYQFVGSRFCPNCGAKMDLEEEDK